MNSSHFRLGGIDCVTKKYTSPYDAKKCKEYRCVECGQKIIFKKGDIKCPHFAHYAHSNCNYYDHPNESQIHKDAKQRIIYWLENKIELKVHKKCVTCETVFIDKIKYQDDDKYLIEKKHADVTIFDSNETPRYIFEVRHTHKTTTNRHEPWYEIEAKEILEYENPNEIILHDIREIECKKCKDLTPIFQEMGLQLGYFVKAKEYYSNRVEKIMDEAIKGKYFYHEDYWRKSSYLGIEEYWSVFLEYKRCIRCRRKSDKIGKNKPYCHDCYSNLIEKIPETSTKESVRKDELMEKLSSFLDRVPGGWKPGDLCHFCDRNDKTNYYYSFTFWRNEKKKICVKCLDEACETKDIY